MSARPGAAALTARERLDAWRRELGAGLVAAVIAIPASVGFGLFAFGSLGERFQGAAVTSALVSACLVPLLCVALGARSGLIYAPRSVISFMVAAVALQGLFVSPVFARDLPETDVALAYVLTALLIAGTAQALAGAARLGAAVKYVPFPVMAGFQNSAAILLFLGQLAPLAGPGIDPPTALAGAVTVALAWYGARITKRVPAPVLGLIGGTFVYHALAWTGWRPAGGMVADGALPLPSADSLLHVPTVLKGLDVIDLAALVLSALGVAIVASMDSLLCARTVEQRTGARSDSNRELLRLGCANAGVACLGGIPSGVQIGPSVASHAAGGRGALSMLAAGAAAGLVLVLAPQALAIVPRCVIAGLLVVIAINLFDTWTLQALGKAARGRIENWRSTALDLGLMAGVAFLAIAVHIVLAVLAGMLAAVAVFVMRMSRPIVRRTYRGDLVRSRRLRPPAENAALAQRGRAVLVMELEGALFFGSAEHVASRIDAATRDGVSIVILDMRRVSDVDSTGARIVVDLHEPLKRRGVSLALAHVAPGGALHGMLGDLGVVERIGAGRVFADTDAALEWAEEQLLRSAPGVAPPPAELALEALDIFAGLSAADFGKLRARLERRCYAKGDMLIREGEPSRELLVIAAGRATARVRTGAAQREIRLTTFSAGVAIGELALFDEQARSASVSAEEDMVCWVLPQHAFESLKATEPALALALAANLGRAMAHRLRRANRTIVELDA